MRVAYLVSRFPLVSHAFILNEVRALRSLGVEVDPFTVVRAAREEVIEPATVDEDARTTALRPVAPARLVADHLAALVHSPAGYARALGEAVGQSAGGVRNLIWQLAYFAQAILLARALRRRGIRHVHVHHANVAADVALLACVFDPRLSWSLSLHGPTEFADAPGHKLALKLERAAWVACISDFARSQAMALVGTEHWAKLHVVRLGVDLEAFRAGEPSAGDRLRILSVGRMAVQKGQHVLLESVARLRDRGVDAHLTLVGDGPLREELVQTVERLGLRDAVVMPGAVGQDGLAALYREADVFALSSFAEGIPVVLMEAMACELPVVAPAINGIPELVEDGESGLLVPPARPDALADALQRLAGEPELRAQFGRAGREKVRSEYALLPSARKLSQLLV